MLESAEVCRELLRCPRSGSPLRFAKDGSAVSIDGLTRYPALHGLPVLIDFERSVIDPCEMAGDQGDSPIERHRYGGLTKFVKRLLSPPKQATRRNVARFAHLLKERSAHPRILVIGGGTVGQGMQPLYDDPDLKVIAFDIYHSEHAHFIADAHAIPMRDGAVDAVVIQAVLEHVLQPREVVDEIWRVLRPGGLVYAETPFLQQVHEGPYDFTRFTESGHRYLFRRFAIIASGVSAGPGTQLLWSLDYFARSLFRSRLAGKAAKLAFFWLNYFDRLIPEAFASDAASGVYFLGAKADATLSAKDIIAFYRGAQQRR